MSAASARGFAPDPGSYRFCLMATRRCLTGV